jgi:hypothetical protein
LSAGLSAESSLRKMATKQSPIQTAKYASGTGVWISFIDEFSSGQDEPTMLGHHTIVDPNSPSTREVGLPLYQTVLVENLHATDVTEEPMAWYLIHCHTVGSIVRVGIPHPESPYDFPAHSAQLAEYADVSLIPSPGAAFAGVPFLTPASTAEGVTTIISVPEISDKLGVTVLYKDTTGHAVSPVPAISGASLGFSAGEQFDWKWVGFVMRRDTSDLDLLHVLGSIEKMNVTRKGPGDLSSSAMYAFSVKESTQALVSPASLVTADIPFTPHQLVEGTPGAAGGTVSPLTFWCIGRVDSEFVNPSVAHKPATVQAASAAMTTVGGVGIWASTDPEMKTWVRIWEAPMGISCPAVHHLNSSSDTEHLEVSRDVGLVFHPFTQRLFPFTIDTDPGQDPWVEEARYAR